MPYISISFMEGRTQEQKNAVAKRVTDVLIEELDVQPEHVWIRFQNTGLGDWFTGGRSESEIRERTGGGAS